jgi:hypothetical protein
MFRGSRVNTIESNIKTSEWLIEDFNGHQRSLGLSRSILRYVFFDVSISLIRASDSPISRNGFIGLIFVKDGNRYKVHREDFGVSNE